MKTYTFFTDFNMTTEIDGRYYSEFMSESDAFTSPEPGMFEVELEYIKVTSDTTAIISIAGYGGDFEIDLDGLLEDEDEGRTISDFFVEGFVCN